MPVQQIIFFILSDLFSMLDFTTQKKLIEPILKRPDNHHCADCNSVAPTWASLDFGVLLCSNCSGAHRGLGPTITRVRSANLDKWQMEWLQNMKVGNKLINAYWEADARASQKKPNSGSTLHEISRYVFEKYVKRKWVEDKDQPDPLTCYKNGQFDISNANKAAEPQSPKKHSKPVEQSAPKIVVEQKPAPVKKADVSLIDFDEPAQPQPPVMVVSNSINPAGKVAEEDQFSEFTQACSTAPVCEQKPKNEPISFQALMNQQKQAPPQPQQPLYSQAPVYQNMQLNNPYNPHLQNNMLYQGQYQQQQPNMAHMYHQRSFNSMPHGYYPQQMGYTQQGPVGTMPPAQGQFW